MYLKGTQRNLPFTDITTINMLQKPGAQNSFRVSHVDDRDLSTQGLSHCFPSTLRGADPRQHN